MIDFVHIEVLPSSMGSTQARFKLYAIGLEQVLTLILVDMFVCQIPVEFMYSVTVHCMKSTLHSLPSMGGPMPGNSYLLSLAFTTHFYEILCADINEIISTLLVVYLLASCMEVT